MVEFLRTEVVATSRTARAQKKFRGEIQITVWCALSAALTADAAAASTGPCAANGAKLWSHLSTTLNSYWIGGLLAGECSLDLSRVRLFLHSFSPRWTVPDQPIRRQFGNIWPQILHLPPVAVRMAHFLHATGCPHTSVSNSIRSFRHKRHRGVPAGMLEGGLWGEPSCSLVSAANPTVPEGMARLEPGTGPAT